MKTITMVGLAAVALAACAGGDDATTPTTVPATTAPTPTTPATPATTAPADADAGLVNGVAWSVAAALGEIPADGATEFELSTADLAGVAELFGVAPPDDLADTDATLNGWLLPLTYPGTPEYRRLPVWLAVQAPLIPTVITDFAAFDELVGWSLADVDAFVDYRPPAPGYFVVARGDFADDALAGLDEAAPGIVSSHAGDDLATDIANIDALDALGRAVRLARADDRIALSLTTPLARRWLAGDGPTLADDARAAAVAEALDAAGVLSAHLFRDQFAFDPLVFANTDPAAVARLIGEAPDLGWFDTVGIGWTVADDGTARTVLAYATLGDASEFAAQLEVVFADGVSFVTGESLADTIGATRPEIVAGDGVVTVTYRPVERYWWSAVQAVYQRDLPFVSG